MRRQHVAAAALFSAMSVAFTWPLARHVGRAVSDPGDPFINIWILDWDWWATLHQPLRLFHANAFWPATYSLAFSENLYGLALLLFPLRAFGAGPIAAYNVAMLAGFAFCGFAAYLLAFRLTANFAASLAAGIFYAFVPFRFTHLAHVQHVWGGWLPLLLLALLLYAERPSPKRAALFAVVFLFNGLTNIHYLLFGAFASLITALFLIPRRDWRNLAIGTGAAMLALAPFLYPYAVVSKLYGMRTYAETLGYSAFARDWILNPLDPERRLFPGFVALGCVIAALFLRQRAKLSLGLLWIAIGFLGSLGLHFEFHRFLWGAVPGFRAIRVPARWAVIAYIGMAVLIALVASRRRRLAWLIVAALAIELYPGHIRYWMTVPEAPPVYAWLASGRSPIIELPIDTVGSEYVYLLRATVHHRPMVNGISGLAPRARVELADKWRARSDDFFDALRGIGVDLVVVHTADLGSESHEVRDWLARNRLTFVRRFDRDWVFSLRSGGARAPFELWDTRGTQLTAGGIDYPSGTAMRGQGYVSGWARSPHGIRSVDVVFENATYRYHADLHGERFILIIPTRPRHIHRETDFLVEITDGRGEVTRLDPRWVTWD